MEKGAADDGPASYIGIATDLVGNMGECGGWNGTLTEGRHSYFRSPYVDYARIQEGEAHNIHDSDMWWLQVGIRYYIDRSAVASSVMNV